MENHTAQSSVATSTAGYFLLLSAALHIFGSILSGFSPTGLFLLFPAVLYTAFFFGLKRGMVTVAWLALICMVGGMAGTLFEIYKVSSVPDWILWGVIAADLGAAICLVYGLGRRN